MILFEGESNKDNKLGRITKNQSWVFFLLLLTTSPQLVEHLFLKFNVRSSNKRRIIEMLWEKGSTTNSPLVFRVFAFFAHYQPKRCW